MPRSAAIRRSCPSAPSPARSALRGPIVLALATTFVGALVHAQRPGPALPNDVPVMLVGDVGFHVERLQPFEATFALARMSKAEATASNGRLDTPARQTMRLERTTWQGREVLARHFETTVNGNELARGVIRLDAASLLPLHSAVTRGGTTTEFAYDWDAFVVTQSPAPEDEATPATESLELRMLEAAVHDVWMAALPLREGFRALLPVIMAGGGGKYWAAPHVVGVDAFDIGDGVMRDAWVVELDWWGMGAAGEEYFPGGGADGSGGSGGKYWVLQDPPVGVPAVVRVRTEVDADTDSVIQLQPRAGS